MPDSLQYRTFNSPGGASVFGTCYIVDQASGIIRPLMNTDFLGNGTGGSVPVTPAVPTNSSAKSIVTISSSFTRPNDLITYTQGDAVTNSTTATTFNVISGAAFATGRGGIIQNLTLMKTGTNITNATFNVHFYTYSGATIPAQDNFPMTGFYANAPYGLGYIAFPTMTALAGTGSVGRSLYQQAALAYSTTDTTNLYWLLEANGAYAPAAAEGFTLTTTLLRD